MRNGLCVSGHVVRASFRGRSFQIRQRIALTEKDWEDASTTDLAKNVTVRISSSPWLSCAEVLHI